VICRDRSRLVVVCLNRSVSILLPRNFLQKIQLTTPLFTAGNAAGGVQTDAASIKEAEKPATKKDL
jgi:hypothetical protein